MFREHSPPTRAGDWKGREGTATGNIHPFYRKKKLGCGFRTRSLRCLKKEMNESVPLLSAGEGEWGGSGLPRIKKKFI